MKLRDQDLYKELNEERETGSILGMISLISMVLLVVMVVLLSCK